MKNNLKPLTIFPVLTLLLVNPLFSCSNNTMQTTTKNIKDLSLPNKITDTPSNLSVFVDKVKTFANNNIPTIYIDWGASMPATMSFLMANAEIAQQDYDKISENIPDPDEYDDIILMPWNDQYDYLNNRIGDLNFNYDAIFKGNNRIDIGYKNRDQFKDPTTGEISFTKALKEGNTFLATSYNCFPDANIQQEDEIFSGYNLANAIDKLADGYAQLKNIDKNEVRFDFVLSNPLWDVLFNYDEGGWDNDKQHKNEGVSELAEILMHANSISFVSDGGYSYSGELGNNLYTIGNNKLTNQEIANEWNLLTNINGSHSREEIVNELEQTPENSNVPWNYLGGLFLTKYKNISTKEPYVTKFCYIDDFDVNEYVSFDKNSLGDKPYDTYSTETVVPTKYLPLDFSQYPNYFGWDSLEVFKSFVTRQLVFNNNLDNNGNINFLVSYIASHKKAYSIEKPCLMLPLNGTLYDFEQHPVEAENYQLMVNYWLEKYPIDKYNYIVKGHPRKEQEATNKWCKHFFGSNSKKVILCYNTVNMEMLFALDMLKNECFHTEKDDSLKYKGYQLIDPNSFVTDNEPQLQFAGIAGFGTSTIYQSIPYLLRMHFGWDKTKQYESRLYTDKTFLLPLTYSPIGLTAPDGLDEQEKIEWLKSNHKLFYDNDAVKYKLSDHIVDFLNEDDSENGRTRNEIINWKKWTSDSLYLSNEKLITCQVMGTILNLYNLKDNMYANLPWYFN